MVFFKIAYWSSVARSKFDEIIHRWPKIECLNDKQTGINITSDLNGRTFICSIVYLYSKSEHFNPV